MPHTIKQATVTKETPKAILVDSVDLDKPLWVPKSVIHDDSEVWDAHNATGELAVQAWWAEKEGL